MDAAIKRTILDLLAEHRIMTIATLRADGWPQATTVGYGNDGLVLYFLCGPESQKAANIRRDGRVSITIDHDTDQVMDIKGLSMAAHAQVVQDESEKKEALGLILSRYSEQKDFPLPMPKPEDLCIVRLTPKVISALDYTKGFAHTDLVTC
jgi:PPOX class probable F420-dependent enzyme